MHTPAPAFDAQASKRRTLAVPGRWQNLVADTDLPCALGNRKNVSSYFVLHLFTPG